MRVLVGIVTYNPDMSRLDENISAVLNEPVDHVLIFDNGSKEISQILGYAESKGIEIYKNNSNAGIASALRYIMDYAVSKDYDWVMTLDQDSVIKPGLVSEYKAYASKLKDSAMLTCVIQDRNFQDEISHDSKPRKVIRCITSAAFTNVKSYQKTEGYDEKMFIDYVDFDMCYSLIEAGFKIYQIPFVGLLHEVGNGKNVSFLGKQQIVYNHSAFRKYYLIRNSIYCAKKHPQFDSPRKVRLRAWREMLFVLLYEENKKQKLKRMCRGYLDGIKMSRKKVN